MNRRNILVAIVGLGVLWVVVFFAASALINQVDDTQVEALPTLTQRPIRTDVPELRASLEPSATIEETVLPNDGGNSTEEAPAATRTPRASQTPEPTDRPTPAFTFSPLELNVFQREQQEEYEAELAAQSTLEIPKDGESGAYPIRLAIEDLGLLASVLVVQTDPNFDIVTPRDEVGYYAGSAKIGAGGNSVMVGHVYPGRVFNRLLDAQVGQLVRITDEHYEEHYYEIVEIIRFPYEIGNAKDRELGFQYMYDDSEERITLVTCYPEFEWTHRFVVRAVPIDPPEDAVSKFEELDVATDQMN
jgi:LPXTG-site transpeptidase (sortase) family protein